MEYAEKWKKKTLLPHADLEKNLTQISQESGACWLIPWRRSIIGGSSSDNMTWKIQWKSITSNNLKSEITQSKTGLSEFKGFLSLVNLLSDSLLNLELHLEKNIRTKTVIFIE